MHILFVQRYFSYGFMSCTVKLYSYCILFYLGFIKLLLNFVKIYDGILHTHVNLLICKIFSVFLSFSLNSVFQM